MPAAPSTGRATIIPLQGDNKFMKRIILPAVLALLLCGCTVVEPQPETAMPTRVTEAPTEPTVPAGIYLPGTAVEAETAGAVRYFQPDRACYGIRRMGSDVLTFSGTDTTVLTRYTGEQLYPVAAIALDCRLEPDDRSFQISANGITYYNAQTREVIFLDNDLKEVSRLGMSESMVGKPVLSGNRKQVFYCTGDAVRVYDTATGLDRLLKSISYARQSVEDVLLNDTVLRCSLVDDKGLEYTIFLSTETGELISQILSGIEVTTADRDVFARIPEGIQQVLVYIPEGQEAVQLTPADPFGESWFLEDQRNLLTATVAEDVTRLDCYDLTTGCRTASVELPGGMEPKFVEVQPETGHVILMAYDALADAPVILSWDRDAMPALMDDQTYTSPRYTAENPDVMGLDACRTLANSIGENYGLRILVGQDAVATQPRDYTLELEYQTTVIRKQLDSLQALLSHFPDGFFEKLYGQTTVCIVRSISGNAASGSVHSAEGVQFWTGQKAYVALAAGDSLEGAFFHEMFHVLDSKILSETREYYYWHNLNPQGCQYFQNYTSYLNADVQQYLEEENRVFIDAYSMCYPKEDRARIMEYACMPGNEHYFTSEIMQSKLKMLCQGIRAAFGLKDHPDRFLWEQYLQE